jgi:hypothetical protein
MKSPVAKVALALILVLIKTPFDCGRCFYFSMVYVVFDKEMVDPQVTFVQDTFHLFN